MTAVRLGLRANAAQFSLLVGVNALVGGMVGLERSVLPLVGEHDFGLHSKTLILSFVLAFGVAKAFTNLAAGSLAERFGRKRVLVIGWLAAVPVPVLIGLAPSWGFIVAANVLLGINQGLAWSMTVIMKIDLAGPARRGLALGGLPEGQRRTAGAMSRKRCRSGCSNAGTRRRGHRRAGRRLPFADVRSGLAKRRAAADGEQDQRAGGLHAHQHAVQS